VVSAFAEDCNGAIWMGFLGRGLLRCDDWQFTRFNPSDGVQGSWIYEHCHTKRGRRKAGA
jgi:hypothetical protein